MISIDIKAQTLYAFGQVLRDYKGERRVHITIQIEGKDKRQGRMDGEKKRKSDIDTFEKDKIQSSEMTLR